MDHIGKKSALSLVYTYAYYKQYITYNMTKLTKVIWVYNIKHIVNFNKLVRPNRRVKLFQTAVKKLNNLSINGYHGNN